MEKPIKKGILLVSFGSSVPSSKVALENMHREVKKSFPGTKIQWAYTSAFIRKKLREQGEAIDSPVVALSKMADDGYTHIAVQSMHTIPGLEYDYLLQTVKGITEIPKGPVKVKVGRPLLYSHQDIELAVDAMIANFPERELNEGVVLMGHGTPHFSNVFYPALNYYFAEKTDGVFLATVEGFPTIQDIIVKLKRNKIDKVFLMPFMSVAGGHVKNDMCGDDQASWYHLLTSAGVKVECILKGTGEINEVVSIWVQHLKDAFYSL
ncbi:sirohydrochlorin cobaltochelatase [Saccharicrinis sp. GN24d3]|uniref:sirohydrochlorin cobaltochelatase n=1 Tax=Saccharicrinis sp. GN24d3 TaxID=3458416 RepID=UPI004036360A